MEDPAATTASRTRTAEAKWRAVDAEQRTSGLSVKAFCVARGASAASLFAWRRRLRPAGTNKALAPTPVSVVEVRPTPVAGLAPTRQDEGPPVELELRDGRRVLVLRRGFDTQLLLEVLAVLEGGPA